MQIRPYYNHLAQLKEHYLEVDSILSGSIPYTVATSFNAEAGPSRHKPLKSYTQLLQDLEDEAYTSGDEHESPEEWMRKGSTWKIRPKTGDRQHGEEEEVGEETALISGEEREERRDRIATIALYGMFPMLCEYTRYSLR